MRPPIHGRNTAVELLGEMLRAAGNDLDVFGGLKDPNDPDLWMVNVRVVPRPEPPPPRHPEEITPARYVPWWVWLVALVVVLGGGGWLQFTIVTGCSPTPARSPRRCWSA